MAFVHFFGPLSLWWSLSTDGSAAAAFAASQRTHTKMERSSCQSRPKGTRHQNTCRHCHQTGETWFQFSLETPTMWCMNLYGTQPVNMMAAVFLTWPFPTFLLIFLPQEQYNQITGHRPGPAGAHPHISGALESKRPNHTREIGVVSFVVDQKYCSTIGKGLKKTNQILFPNLCRLASRDLPRWWYVCLCMSELHKSCYWGERQGAWESFSIVTSPFVLLTQCENDSKPLWLRIITRSCFRMLHAWTNKIHGIYP